MKRTLLLGAAWTASAASAVGLGFLAVSLVDASATGTVPLAAAATAPSAGETAASPSASTATTAAGTKATVAGTVSAVCASGTPRVSGAPATGWWIDDSDDADAGEVEFEDGSRKLEVHVTCVDGSPRFTVEGPRADNSGGDDDAVPSAPATTDAPDDSDGRVGGGHGGDDPAGDDSGSGGHGSDDSGSDDSGGHGGDDSDSDDSGGHGSDD
jgi:hypothetical protein